MKTRHFSKILDSHYFSFFALSNLLTQTCLHFCRTGQLTSSEHAKCTQSILFIITFVCLSVPHAVVTHVHLKTHTENSTKPTDMNYSSSPPSLQKGEGQLTPSLTFVQRYERLRESQRRLWVYIPGGYFNPSLSPSTKQYSFPSDRQRKTEFLTFIPIMTITTIYTKKYMDINVYSFPHRLDVMILNANYLKQRG